MPYKDPVLQRGAIRRAVQKHRGITLGITEKEDFTAKGITLEEGITEYHPIMYALLDPVKREKLQRICDSLRRRNLLSKVYYGMRSPLDFGTVSDLLEATASTTI